MMIEALERLGPPGAAKQAGLDAQPPAPAKLKGHQRRLIKPATPKPPSVKRDRNNDRIVRPAIPQRRHVPRHGSSQRDLAAIFELERDRARQVVIGHGRPHPVELRRLHEASGASLNLCPGERQTATIATRIAEPFHLAPAGGAECTDLVDHIAASRTARRQREVQQQLSDALQRLSDRPDHMALSRLDRGRTSAPVTRDLFDRRLRALRRDRAARTGPEMFLFDRSFDECLDRLRDIRPTFGHALLIGCPSPDWAERLRTVASQVQVLDPGALFAGSSGGRQGEEDRFDFGESRYDVCVAVGTLDTVNDLPLAFQLLHRALKPDSPLIGAIAGGNSLPALRASLIDAGRSRGQVVARAHPRIEPSSLAGLLTAAGFAMPVVDVDRVRLRYASLDGLIGDLRAMGVTSTLANRAPPMTRSEAQRARDVFASRGSDGRTEEQVEILHFLGWRQ